MFMDYPMTFEIRISKMLFENSALASNLNMHRLAVLASYEMLD